MNFVENFVLLRCMLLYSVYALDRSSETRVHGWLLGVYGFHETVCKILGICTFVCVCVCVCGKKS